MESIFMSHSRLIHGHSRSKGKSSGIILLISTSPAGLQLFNDYLRKKLAFPLKMLYLCLTYHYVSLTKAKDHKGVFAFVLID